MNVISTINYKGGVGKTTLTANIAAELAWRNYNVLLIDLDPQTSLTFSFVHPDYWEQNLKDTHTIKNWFDSLDEQESVQLNNLIIQPSKVNEQLRNRGTIDLIPSHLGLINVDLELATELGGGTLTQTKKNYLKVHRRLINGLKDIDNDNYDIIFIDCPPNFNIVTKNAIVASDNVLIPAKPDFLSTMGIDYLIRNLSKLIKDYNEFVELDPRNPDEYINPEILGVVFTMIQEYNKKPVQSMRPFMRQVSNLGIPVFSNYIKENKTIFADSPQYGVPVAIKSFSSNSHQSVVDGIEDFVSEFENKIGSED
jgi:chromosome partitioning protein